MRIAAPVRDGVLLTSLEQPTHFKLKEFECKCECFKVRGVDVRLMDGLESLRTKINCPLVVVSGGRCVQHNADVGGAPLSQHLLDENGIVGAADLRIIGANTKSLAFVLAMSIYQLGGIGLGINKLHVDSRIDRASWMYGKYRGQKPERWIAALMVREFASN